VGVPVPPGKSQSGTLERFWNRNPVKLTNPETKLKKNLETGKIQVRAALFLTSDCGVRRHLKSIAQPGNLVVKRFEVIRICPSI
jgi:hypothetical protein